MMSATSRLDNRERRFPSFLLPLALVEMWERFSYYGMRSLLVLYLTTQLGFTDAHSYSIYALVATIGYAGPVLFGIAADKIFGFRYMIIFGSIIMTLGHLVMTLTEVKPDLIYLGLALIAIGTGAFKGNIAKLLGKCYSQENANREGSSTIFYVSINTGSALASILCGLVAHNFGWCYGFGLAGIGMLLGLATFIYYQKTLGIVGKSPIQDIALLSKFKTYLSLILAATIIAASWGLSRPEIFSKAIQIFGGLVLAYYLYNMSKAEKHQRFNLFVILVLIFFCCLFFALEMQIGALINLFTERNVNRTISGFTIPAAVLQAINPAFILFLGPLFNILFKFNPKYRFSRFALGLAMTSLCFFILHIGCLHSELGKVPYAYLLLGVMYIGIGELLISPFIQSQISLLAPERQQGFIMSMTILSLAFANILGGEIAKRLSLPSFSNIVDPVVSLPVYQEGFKQIALYNLAGVGIFVLLIPILNKAYKRISH